MLSINRIRTTPTPKVPQENALPSVVPVAKSDVSTSIPNTVPTRETRKMLHTCDQDPTKVFLERS